MKQIFFPFLLIDIFTNILAIHPFIKCHTFTYTYKYKDTKKINCVIKFMGADILIIIFHLLSKSKSMYQCLILSYGTKEI